VSGEEKLLLPDEAATERLGEEIGRLAYPGLVVALIGELGSGKTALTRGLARGLGVPEDVPVVSPSFTLVNEYPQGRLPLYHIDLYRLAPGEEDFFGLGIEDYLYGRGVSSVEWAERLPEPPGARLDVRLALWPPETGDARLAELEAHGPKARELLEGVKTALDLPVK